MRYDMIASFYEKAEDTKPRYSSPLGLYLETIYGDLNNKGFHMAPDSTPGYLDYEKDNVTVEEIEELTQPGYVSEVMDILYCTGIDFERISLRAWEVEHIDDYGGIPPFGVFIGKTFVRLEMTEPMSPVHFWNCDVSNHEGEELEEFIIPLKRLRDYFGVLTMYEVRDCLKEQFATENPMTYEELRTFWTKKGKPLQ